MTKTLKKTLPVLLSLLGVALFTFIAAKAGVHPVMDALAKVGIEGFLMLAVCQLLVDVGLGLAWHAAVPQLGLMRLMGARLVRDAAGACLPFSQLGGIVIGVRATLAGVDPRAKDGTEVHWPEAVAANLVDITTEVLGQIAFVLVALLCLIGHHGAARFVWPLTGGMALLSVGIAGFIWTQHRGGRMIRKVATFLGRHIASEWRETLIDNTEIFQSRLESLWGRPDRISLGALCHLVCWMGSAGLTWLGLHLLGAHVGVIGAVAIEGVVCGIMSAGFLVPGALGVQEAAYVALGLLFGIDAEISLSLSLLRRGRDIMIGIPVLVAWQIVEMRRLRHERVKAGLGPEPLSMRKKVIQPAVSALADNIKKEAASREDAKAKDAVYASARRVS